MRVPASAAEDVAIQHQPAATDASLTSDSAHEEVESSARLVTAPLPTVPRRQPLRPTAELVPMPARPAAEPSALPEEPPRYNSRNWRAEAWDRERERELRSVERLPDTSARRRSGS